MAEAKKTAKAAEGEKSTPTTATNTAAKQETPAPAVEPSQEAEVKDVTPASETPSAGTKKKGTVRYKVLIPPVMTAQGIKQAGETFDVDESISMESPLKAGVISKVD